MIQLTQTKRPHFPEKLEKIKQSYPSESLETSSTSSFYVTRFTIFIFSKLNVLYLPTKQAKDLPPSALSSKKFFYSKILSSLNSNIPSIYVKQDA